MNFVLIINCGLCLDAVERFSLATPNRLQIVGSLLSRLWRFGFFFLEFLEKFKALGGTHASKNIKTSLKNNVKDEFVCKNIKIEDSGKKTYGPIIRKFARVTENLGLENV